MDYNVDYLLRMSGFQQNELKKVEREDWIWNTFQQDKRDCKLQSEVIIRG